MATQALTPTQLVRDGAGLNLTPLLTAPAQTTLQLSNSGREFLLIQAAAGAAESVTVQIGATVLGQPVTPFTSVTLTATDLYAFGPFSSQVDQPGGHLVDITLSATANVTVLLLQVPSVS